jgi:hypothetical protein
MHHGTRFVCYYKVQKSIFRFHMLVSFALNFLSNIDALHNIKMSIAKVVAA